MNNSNKVSPVSSGIKEDKFAWNRATNVLPNLVQAGLGEVSLQVIHMLRTAYVGVHAEKNI
jgi:hypothetical protein